MWHFLFLLCFRTIKDRLKHSFFWRAIFPLVVSAISWTSPCCMHTVSSASNASFLTSKWKVPSFVLFLPRWHPLSPFRHHQKAEQDAENLKNGPLWAARGSADTIKEWYRLQIMHVSGLILILCERNGTAQTCKDALQRPCMLNNALTLADQGHLPSHQRDGKDESLTYNLTLKPSNKCTNGWDTAAV